MNPIRVLVIDDSAFMRKMISSILTSDDRIQVIATARNGSEGLMKIKDLAPDVVTLDVEMPIMDGIETLQKIMQASPLPVIMLSSITGAGAHKTVQAISSGAVDFIQKPSGAISLDIETIKQEIINKVIAASKVKVTEDNQLTKAISKVYQPIKEPYKKTIVAIGTSTGGPRALQKVLTDLPDDFMPPILIVQHMPAGFTKSLAERLNTIARVHVKEAVHGEIILNNTAYIAPGDYHMRVRQVGTANAIELTKEEQRNGHRPSVDILFESIAKLNRINKIAVVLTGMGSDGAKGIQYLKKKDANAIAIAESEESSIIYGMPKAAVQTNVVDYIAHLHQVGETISNLIKVPGRM